MNYPRGQFEFTTSGGVKLSGRVCTWSLNRFCEKMDIPTVTELFSVITLGISIRAIAEILLSSVEYTFRGKDFTYTLDDAMDWIDDLGGLNSAVKIIEDSVSSKDDDKGNKKKASRK